MITSVLVINIAVYNLRQGGYVIGKVKKSNGGFVYLYIWICINTSIYIYIYIIMQQIKQSSIYIHNTDGSDDDIKGTEKMMQAASSRTRLRCATASRRSALISTSHFVQPGTSTTLRDHGYGLVCHTM